MKIVVVGNESYDLIIALVVMNVELNYNN